MFIYFTGSMCARSHVLSGGSELENLSKLCPIFDFARRVKVKPPARRKSRRCITTLCSRTTTRRCATCWWHHGPRQRRPRSKPKLHRRREFHRRSTWRQWRHMRRRWRHIRWTWLICEWSCAMPSYGVSFTHAPTRWLLLRLAGIRPHLRPTIIN